MKCHKVSSRLSCYVDEMLDNETAIRVSEHLRLCDSCRAEYNRLIVLRRKLGALGTVTAPPYLRHLVQLRMVNAPRENWRVALKEALQYRWSRIRTTEGLWFMTRISGTVATCILFMAISVAMNPIYLQFHPAVHDRGGPPPNVRMQLGASVLKNLGIMSLEAQRRPISPTEPQINDLYLLNFGESASRARTRDDTFSVVTVVDRSGSAKIQDVLEYPADSELLSEFSTMISSARYRPAIQNGRAVDSHLVMTFSKISVYD